MAGGGGGLQAPQRSKRGKQSKRKRAHRVGFVMDMTPLVDINMLLLTFFMFTTTMLKPQIMEMKIPPERIDDKPVDMRVSELFYLLIREDGKIFAQYGNPSNTAMEDPKPIDIKKIQELAVKQNLKQGITANRLVTVLKVDQKAKYDFVIKVLNELNLAEYSIAGEFAKKTDPETHKPIERKRKFTFGILEDADIEKIKGL